MSETPKIIVDTDWKTQARAEKERLSGTERPSAVPTPPKTAVTPPGAALAAPAGEKPPAAGDQVEGTFEELLRLLATQALMYLGAFPDPETGRAIVSLEYAKLHIDLLAVLEQKTKGNLTEQESSLLTRTLYELRMQYVEIAKAVAKAVEEGRISKAGQPLDPKRAGTPR